MPSKPQVHVPHKSRTELAEQLEEKNRKIREQEAQIKELSKENRHLGDEQTDSDRVRQEIFKLSKMKVNPPEWLTERPTGPIHGPGCPVAFASDWHFGEVIDPKQVNDRNEFNPLIAEQRAKTFFSNIVMLLKQHMVHPIYPGIVLCLGGDMVSGDIHDELTNTNGNTTMQAVSHVTRCLISGINLLQKEFGRVAIPCVSGNHGRTTLKTPTKNRAYTNFDWLICNQLEQYYSTKYEGQDSPVKFMISSGIDQRFDIYDKKFLLTHGDNLGKGGDGIIGALGPILRGDTKMRSTYTQLGQSYDVMLCGHYHQLLWLSKVICNGSLCGYSEFANTIRCAFEPPRQALFCVHPEHGITYQMPINVELSQHSPKQVPWFSWPA